MGSKDRAATSRFISRAGLVAKRDLRDAISELRLLAAMVALTLAVPIGSAAGVRGLAYFGGGTAVVNRLSLVGAFFVVFIPASFSLVLALEAFVGERERTTLEVLLSTPLKEAEIYAGKVIAVLAVSLTLCYGGLLVYCLIVFPGLGYFPLDILVALASFIILPMSVVLQVEAALILLGRPEYLWGFALIMTVMAVLLLRMGFNGFSREALLAREVGLRRPLHRAGAALRWSFNNRPGLLRLVWTRRVPMLIAAAGFPIGIGAGYLAGVTSAIPTEVVRPVLSNLISASGGGSRLEEFVAILSHNLLAFALVGLLAVITAGLSGFALTFAPGFLVGFAAAFSSWAIALSGIVPNGLIEVPIAIIAGGLAIHIGAAAIHMDPRGGWSARVLLAMADYVRALRWLVPGLVVAAALEVWLG